MHYSLKTTTNLTRYSNLHFVTAKRKRKIRRSRQNVDFVSSRATSVIRQLTCVDYDRTKSSTCVPVSQRFAVLQSAAHLHHLPAEGTGAARGGGGQGAIEKKMYSCHTLPAPLLRPLWNICCLNWSFGGFKGHRVLSQQG